MLVILKYKVYRFEFIDNEKLPKGEYIALVRGCIKGNIAIEYKMVEDNILIVRKGL